MLVFSEGVDICFMYSRIQVSCFMFFAKTTGILSKYCATIHAIPMPDASTVSIFVTSSFANLF